MRRALLSIAITGLSVLPAFAQAVVIEAEPGIAAPPPGYYVERPATTGSIVVVPDRPLADESQADLNAEQLAKPVPNYGQNANGYLGQR
ncbi:MAG: hypothetical protein JO048_06360 [Methylobacteriaceae bacterium]|nr:hypothetical protein [Methylobacteriaceae bacterium]